ncbi:MAG: hypothetical protein R2867_40670 [Caldilineaceae bacterium]
MSTALSRRRFLQATGVGLSLPLLSQLLTACQAVRPTGSSQSITEITWSRRR